MANFNTTDILVRRQRLACYIAEFGSNTINAQFLGKSCWEKHLEDLKLLVGYSKILGGYRALVDETLATCTLTLTGGSSGIVTVKLNNQIIGSATYTTSLTNTASLLATSIDTTCDDLALTIRFTADSSGTSVIISAPVGTGDLYNDLILSVSTTGNLTTTITAFSNGVTEVTEDDNCLTEEQAQDMWEQVAKLSGLCFLPIGTTYIDYEDTLPQYIRVTQNGDTRITSAGDVRTIIR